MARSCLVALTLLLLLSASQWGRGSASHATYTVQSQELLAAAAARLVPPLRMGYHFRPPNNWINDPNGPMYYKGLYHLFYQYNPRGAIWGNIVWAHSVSKDLVNWEALPPAIAPTIPSDILGCWSGSATILHNGVPAILYTGLDAQQRQVQNVAFPKDPSDPYLREWIKPSYNPIAEPVDGINASSFRDPTTAWYSSADGRWRMIVGSKFKERGVALLYRSRDFKRWTKARRPLHSAPNTGMWECPDFYPVPAAAHNNIGNNNNLGLDLSQYAMDPQGRFGVGVKHVLKVSLDDTRFDYYTVGRYDHKADRYILDGSSPDSRLGLRYDYGNFYASKTFYDAAKHRRILWGWANESDHLEFDKAKGWAGIQSIPRAVWLAPGGGQLMQWPIQEMETLRHNHVSLRDKIVKAGEYLGLEGLQQTAQADVEVTFRLLGSSLEKAEVMEWRSEDAQALCERKNADVRGGIGPFGLWVLASHDLRERTAVFFRVFNIAGAGGKKHSVLMCTDPRRSSYEEGVYKPTFAGFVDVDPTQIISLRTLIDNSVVESFGGGGKTCILSRVYPTLAVGPKAHLFLFNNGQVDIQVSALDAWEMKKPFMNDNQN